MAETTQVRTSRVGWLWAYFWLDEDAALPAAST